MDKIPNEISANEARAALESIAKTDKQTNETIRPPLWLTTVISGFYAMMTFSWASTRHENLWMLGLIISTAGFLLSILFYFYTSRLLGLRLSLVPKNKPEFWFHFLSAILFALGITLSREFSVRGFEIAAYIGASTNGLLLAFLLHKYSVMAPTKGLKSDGRN
ncbi:hypothetical protein OAP14_08655 [Aliiglaciecola sp.]|nr:hypothetical protein [Aliiglaciecola sp.]